MALIQSYHFWIQMLNKKNKQFKVQSIQIKIKNKYIQRIKNKIKINNHKNQNIKSKLKQVLKVIRTIF